MNFNEIQELIENVYLGKIKSNELLSLSNKTYICFVDEPSENLIKFGVYNSTNELTEVTKIADLGSMEINSSEDSDEGPTMIYMDQLYKVSQNILDYLTENNLTVELILYDDGYDTLGYDYESIETSKFNMLVEEIKAEYSK